jgi:WD40 repeat protein
MPLLKKRSPIGEEFDNVWHVRVKDYIVGLGVSKPADACYVVTGDGKLVSVSLADGKPRFLKDAHKLGTNCIAVSEDGSVIATGGQDNCVRTWSASDGEALGEWSSGTTWPDCLLAAKGGSRFLCGAGKRLVALSERCELQQELGLHKASIADMAWHPYKPQFLTASYGEVRLWNAETLEQLESLAYQGSILKLAMSPNGRILATGNQDATVHFWRLQEDRDSQMWGYPRKVRELSWNRDSRYLATGGGDGVTVWDFSGKGPEGSTPIQLTSLGSPLTLLEYQPEGNLLAGGTEHGHVFVWNPLKRDNVVALEMISGAVSALQWLPVRGALLAASAEGDLCRLQLSSLVKP